MASYSAIIAAAGKGERFGQRNKLKEKLGGKAVISHSLDHFGGDDDCAEIIVVVDGAIREWIEGNPLLFASTKIRLVEGGPSRAASVANGVAGASAPLLIIHDAARPNFGADLLARIIGAVKPEIGVVPGVFIPDTVAYVSEIDKGGNGSGNQGEGVLGAARAEPGAGTLLAEPGAGTFEDRTEHRQGHI
ncbi:2-C-methyl-D-erythritol 4-phosphate cytidylyltransferase, partial [bacterium]|nr:2-C-methyl-D-erythritol 4-phosphate cytidylyltransferase [bacterium]